MVKKAAAKPVPSAPTKSKSAPARKTTPKKPAAKQARKQDVVQQVPPELLALVPEASPASAAAPVKKPVRKKPVLKAVPVAMPAAPAAPAPLVPGSPLEKNLKSRPINSVRAPLRIFQIYFQPWQKELLDPAFVALDNSKATAESLEFDVFERLARSKYVEGCSLWGALSWRYTEKTGLTGTDLLKVIDANPGMDVYYCNPHVQNEGLFHNMWVQGDTSHPQFLELCREVFQACGLPQQELTGIAPPAVWSAANYFVGTPAFWNKYLQWVRAILTMADQKLPPKARALLHSSVADAKGVHGGASYVPFIVERLFPLFMKTAGRGLKGYKIALPEREREMNVHVKLLREMKEMAHRTNSAWLAACWVNYRNLYFSQTNGRAWCDKHLRAITPTEVRFA